MPPPGMPGGFPPGGVPGAPGMPGFPGGTQQQPGSGQSTISFELVDKIVTLKADIDWNEDK